MATVDTLTSALKRINPAIDASDPIIQDVFVKFGANIIDDVSTRVVALQNKYTNVFLANLNDAELDTYAYQTRGLTRLPGKASNGYLYLSFVIAPSSDISIGQNLLFSTTDGKWQYYSSTGVYISLADLSNFYNPVRGVYELRIPAQAIRTGADYNAAAYRITVLKSTLPFTANVENREPFSGGTDPETSAEFISRYELANAGFDSNSTLGITTDIKAKTAVTDLQIQQVAPDANVFNVAIIGTNPLADSLVYTLQSATDRRIAFPSYSTPIRYVTAVVMNGTVLDSTQYRYTTTELILSQQLTLVQGQQVVIGYQFNGLIQDVKAYLNNTVNLSGATWIVKEAIPVQVSILVLVKLSTFLTVPEVQDLIVNSILNTLNGSHFLPNLSAITIEQDILAISQNILDAKVSLGVPNSNGVVVWAPQIEFAENSYPTAQLSNITVGEL